MNRHDTLIALTDDHYEAARSLNHARKQATPAPTLYAILGNLKTSAGYGIAQALTEFARQLAESATVYDLYDTAANPAESITTATALLTQAAEHATQVGDILELAQQAIASQGYHTPDDAA